MIYIAFMKCENTPASQHEAGVALRDRLFSFFGIIDEVKRTENGKPYVDDPRYHFSISHTNEIAVCAMRCHEENYNLPEDVFTVFEDGEGEIGIDIQAFPSDNELERLNKIAARFFDKTFDTAEDFVYHWTKAEAFCKNNGSVLADAFKADFNNKSFFCCTIEFDSAKYIMSVCY